MRRRKRTTEWHFSKEMWPLIIVTIVSWIETFVLKGEKSLFEDPKILTMRFFDLVISALSIWVIVIIWKRNKENRRDGHTPTGRSREALKITGWLLIAMAAKTIAYCITH